jgi:N-dimethylarginine dimethylaminohydrolase
MLSKNEWDPLKSVIVGIADDARIPLADTSLRMVNYADVHKFYKIPSAGLYPKQVIDEANEDLDLFSKFLESCHVKVHRPDKSVVPSYYNYCPRDSVLVHDDTIIATPMPLRSRQDEYKALLPALSQHGDVLVPRFPRDSSLYNSGCLGNPDILALTETEPAFDAANILRSNDDLFYLVSNSGNKKGAELLQMAHPDKKVHTIEGVYSYMHLDSTIALLREGLMLLNPARIKSVKQLPKVLQSWDVIWAPEPVDIGHYPGYCNASTWVSVNLFSVSPTLAIVEEHQNELRLLLEDNGIEVKLMAMRHARTLGGCFHCVTLDLERDHNGK